MQSRGKSLLFFGSKLLDVIVLILLCYVDAEDVADLDLPGIIYDVLLELC